MSAILRSPLYRTALTPPVCLPSALLEVGVIVLSVPVGPPDAAHDILGQLTSADAPCSRSFPVIFQLADVSRWCETGIVNINVKKSTGKHSPFARVAYRMPPVLPPVVSLWVKSLHRVSIGLVERARRKLPYALGTVRRCYNGVVSEKEDT